MDNSLQELQLRDYLDILRRRRLWIFFTALGCLVMGAVVAVRLPNLYHTETVIVVDPQQDSAGPNSSSALDRLSMVRQLVLSPTRLEELIQTQNLFPGTQGRRNVLRLVASMQQSITVDVADAGNQRLSAFKIGYTSRYPQKAAEIANQLASAVVNESLKAREHQLVGTEEFLDSELQDTQRQLEQKEAEVSRIKTQYLMVLPESKQFHLEALENLRSQLRSSQDRVSRDQTEKVYLQSTLANSNPAIDVDANNGEVAQSPTQAKIEKLEANLVELRTRYGPSYPDVRKVQSQIESLKAQKAEEDANAPKRDVSTQVVARAAKNPVITSQLNKLDQEIAEQTKVQAQLNQQIEFHVSQLEQIPIFESRIAGLMRDYDSLRNHYNSLLDRKISARMASNLDQRQKAERFQTLDVAKVPEKPVSPNRPLIALGALFGGLFAGIGVALVIDMTDTSVRGEKEAERILGAPVLAGIPVIVSAQEWFIKQMYVALGIVAVVLVSAGAGLIITFVSGRMS